MELISLGSGSSGNMHLLKINDKYIAIDCGLTLKEIKTGLEYFKINPEDISDIIITHEHLDHIKGLKSFINKYNPNVHCNFKTVKEIRCLDNRNNIFIFSNLKEFFIKNIRILPIPLNHDASDPVGFQIFIDDKTLFMCSDMGSLNKFSKKAIESSEFIFIESNYEDNLIDKSNRPKFLIERVKSRIGHTSNKEALNRIKPFHKKVFLSHISKDCNSIEYINNRINSFITNKKPQYQNIEVINKLSKYYI